jgi:hypothetical protein
MRGILLWTVFFSNLLTIPVKADESYVQETALAGQHTGMVQTTFSFDEPISVANIDALERAFPKIQKPDNRLQAAAVLYRYGRDAGRAYLLQHLNKYEDSTSATILAKNQEQDYLSKVLEVFSKQEEPDAELVRALTEWNQPEVTDAILKKYVKNPQNGLLALSLARLNVKEAVPQMKQEYSKSTTPIGQKKFLAAALVKLGADKNGGLLSGLFRDLSPEQSASPLKATVINALEWTADTRVVPYLQAIIRQYISARELPRDTHSGKNSPDQIETEVRFPQEMIVTRAALTLISLQDHSSAKLLSQLLIKLKSAPQVYDYKGEIAKELLDSNYPGMEPVIEELMGKAWVTQHKTLKTLKPIPTRLTEFSPDFNWVWGVKILTLDELLELTR